MTEDAVFLLDVDNTLLDGDYLVADLRRFIATEIGAPAADRYWAIFNAMLSELGYVDYLGALQRYRLEVELRNDALDFDPQHLPRIANFLMDYPFKERLYNRAFEVIRHLAGFGQCVILTDGDVGLQTRKIQRAGLWDALAGRVLIYVHKEKMLGEVARRYPARHYVIIDDKPGILAAVKAIWRSRVTTVLPLQGHYALDAAGRAAYPAPDIVINNIGQLADFNLPVVFGKRLDTIEYTA